MKLEFKKILFIMLLAIFSHNLIGQSLVNGISKELKDEATVIFIGVYSVGNGTCFEMPDGTLKKRLDVAGFHVEKDFIGNMKSLFIEVYPYSMTTLENEKNVKTDLIVGRKYMVLLKPKKSRMELITDEKIMDNVISVISAKEIIAILEVTAE